MHPYVQRLLPLKELRSIMHTFIESAEAPISISEHAAAGGH